MHRKWVKGQSAPPASASAASGAPASSTGDAATTGPQQKHEASLRDLLLRRRCESEPAASSSAGAFVRRGTHTLVRAGVSLDRPTAAQVPALHPATVPAVPAAPAVAARPAVPARPAAPARPAVPARPAEAARPAPAIRKRMQWTRNSPRARLAAAATAAPSVAPRSLTPSQRYGLLRKGSSYLRLTGRSLVRLPEQRPEAGKSAAAEPAQGARSRHAAMGGAAPLRKHLTLLMRGGAAYELARGGRALQRVGVSKGAVRAAPPSSAGASSGEGSGEGGKSGGAPRPAASSAASSGGGSSSHLAPSSRLPRPAAPPRPQPRRVQLGWQEFVRSGDGRSLQRSTSARQRQAASTL